MVVRIDPPERAIGLHLSASSEPNGIIVLEFAVHRSGRWDIRLPDSSPTPRCTRLRPPLHKLCAYSGCQSGSTHAPGTVKVRHISAARLTSHLEHLDNGGGPNVKCEFPVGRELLRAV